MFGEVLARSGEVPVIETERLRLRGYRREDFAECAAMWGDAGVTRYVGGKPLTEEETWARVLRYIGHWGWMGFGYWVVEEKASGNFAVEVGFAERRSADSGKSYGRRTMESRRSCLRGKSRIEEGHATPH
jgi:RimJ/RimL family protein N-acetyltransferase